MKCEDKYAILHDYKWYSTEVYGKFQAIIWTLTQKYIDINIIKQISKEEEKEEKKNELIDKINMFSILIDDKYNQMLHAKVRLLCFRKCIVEITRIFNNQNNKNFNDIIKKFIDIIKKPFTEKSIISIKSIILLAKTKMFPKNIQHLNDSLYIEYYIRSVFENLIDTIYYIKDELDESIKKSNFDYEIDKFNETADEYTISLKNKIKEFWKIDTTLF
jgi:hypothetical protein